MQLNELQLEDNCTKGELMKMTYGKDNLSNIDASLPASLGLTPAESFYFVMNYRNNFLGELQDMREEIKKTGWEITNWHSDVVNDKKTIKEVFSK